MDRYIFNPFSLILLVLFLALMVFIIPFLLLGVIGGALTKLGFTWGEALLLLFGMLLGSFINIPLKKIENPQVVVRREYPSFGFFYRIRELSPTTMVAINVGGAVIPTAISLYLIYHTWEVMEGSIVVIISALIGVAIVATITYRVAKPVPGLGIATPFFIPPLSALICGLVLSWGNPMMAPVIAYTSGTLGTLIGADLLNLNKISELGAPVASIGGAGTFDGIFLSGIIAAFLV